MKTFVLFMLVFHLVASLPQSSRKAEPCTVENCDLANQCVCLSQTSPLTIEETPQFVVLTFDDGINVIPYNETYRPLLADRVNPDGNPIGATFFISHQYTSYITSNEIYNEGYEIGINSVTKKPEFDYWANADAATLVKEFKGQKTILNTFANIPWEDMKGVRTPFLQLNGDNSFQAYGDSELIYDNSWSSPFSKPLYPYTLDHGSTQDCLLGKCPAENYPAFSVLPVNNLRGLDGIQCNALAGCLVEGTATEVTDWLKENFDRVHQADKAPQTIILNYGWLSSLSHHEAFINFLDYIQSFDDVFLVAQEDLMAWRLNPQPLGVYQNPPKEREAPCSPVTCQLDDTTTGGIVWMGSCVDCPAVYPSLDNPEGTA